ncbi:MAG: cytidine deaminase [Chloroflexota bacterium]
MTDDKLAHLIEQAEAARHRAYVPYSDYRVGAALLSVDGTVFTGCNVENASYPASICAERTALVKAVSEGFQTFDMIVIATDNGGSPCGICRQMLYEFAPELRVICVDANGATTIDAKLADLLTHGFGPSSLPVSKDT